MEHKTKGWGQEFIWASTDQYCGKFLNFNNNTTSSMHFHANKDETWFVQSGIFVLNYIDTTNATIHSKELQAGDIWRNPPLQPHQLICKIQGTILEVSTKDSESDNYRILPGDSQK